MWDTWVRSLGWEDTPGEGNGTPLQYSCLENPMGGWRSLVGYSPWGRKELDTTERRYFHFSFCTYSIACKNSEGLWETSMATDPSQPVQLCQLSSAEAHGSYLGDRAEAGGGRHFRDPCGRGATPGNGKPRGALKL